MIKDKTASEWIMIKQNDVQLRDDWIAIWSSSLESWLSGDSCGKAREPSSLSFTGQELGANE